MTAANAVCLKHGEGFGKPCYLCVDEANRELKELLVRALLVLRDVGSGPFSMDPHQHAINVIEANRADAAVVLSDPLAVELLKEADRDTR